MRVLSALSSVVLLLAPSVSWAADALDFIVPDNDGYGVAECMKPGMACGQVIADAWCEAHGHAKASAYGLSEDVTGSVKISASSAAAIPPGSVLIHCGE